MYEPMIDERTKNLTIRFRISLYFSSHSVHFYVIYHSYIDRDL